MAKYESKKSKVQQYKDEFTNWLNTLENWQTRFKTNYKRYTGYNETKGTETKISDPVAFELTERLNQKLFERDPKFYAEANVDLPKEIKNIITAVASHYWNNQDMVQTSGTIRSRLKVFGREFIITGNGAVESFWNGKDFPDMRVIPIEDIVFDPARTLKTSPKYYVRQFVSLKYLKDNVELKENGEVVSGMFDPAAIKKLEKFITNKDQKKDNPSSNVINRSGTDNQAQVDQFQLISRWEKEKCCRFVMDDDMEDPILVQEFTSILKDDPIDLAMDIEVVKEPYAISILDTMKGLLKAKDLLLNQTIDYGAKVLNPPTVVNPQGTSVNLKTIANMYKLGGIVIGDPSAIKQQTVDSSPTKVGLEMMNWIEGRGESISGAGAYMSGVPNQVSDKTAGTKGGIEALIDQSVSPVKDRQQNIEESIIEPMINKWLKMVGATMSETDIKWILMTGESPHMIKVTKGLLTGKIKLTDLMQADIIKPEEVQAYVDLMMQNGKDPEKDVLFDVDWMIRVETGSLAEQDTSKDVENKKMLLELALSTGVPVDIEKMWKDIALDAGMKEPDQYINKEAISGGNGQIPAEGMGQTQPGLGTPEPTTGVPAMAGQGSPIGA